MQVVCGVADAWSLAFSYWFQARTRKILLIGIATLLPEKQNLRGREREQEKILAENKQASKKPLFSGLREKEPQRSNKSSHTESP